MMMVQALVSFVARIDGNAMTVRAGQIITLPAGADWLTAGLVTPVPDDQVETAVLPMLEIEHTVTRRKRT